ncbi:hypothetical protein KM043_013046 [Ampulex compressa]|nr:hypothetical protein KM043_013046 [Ampulex compressa]
MGRQTTDSPSSSTTLSSSNSPQLGTIPTVSTANSANSTAKAPTPFACITDQAIQTKEPDSGDGDEGVYPLRYLSDEKWSPIWVTLTAAHMMYREKRTQASCFFTSGTVTRTA